MKELIKRHRHLLVNIFVFVNVAFWAAKQTYIAWSEGRLDYVEISFAAENALMAAYILARKDHLSLEGNYFHQGVALVAFFSGMAFIGAPVTGGPVAANISKIMVFLANIIGVVAFLNLGRSFGILIAYREIKTGGLYSVIRHPMYGSVIFLRIGYMVSHFTILTISLFLISTAAYIYRALLEERFLSAQPEYREYMKRVRYRFIPLIY